MLRARFRRLVDAAMDSIPEELFERIENLQIIVRTRPTPEELADADIGPHGTLLGLYQGYPLASRGSNYGNTLPDRIFIYQESIELICATEDEVLQQIRTTVLHEVAHHFGIDDDRLHELGLG